MKRQKDFFGGDVINAELDFKAILMIQKKLLKIIIVMKDIFYVMFVLIVKNKSYFF